MTKSKPNPGSKEAIEKGCTCAVLDNHYGKGFPVGTDEEGKEMVSFWITQGCPVHGSMLNADK